jgi:predicted PurR-regulated permease PerM
MSNNDIDPYNGPKVATDGPDRVSRDVTRTMLQVLFIGLLIGAVAWIIRPFITSMIWAGMIVVTTWPILLALQARLKIKRWLAAAIMTVALLLVVVVPILFALTAIILRAGDIYEWLKSLATLTIPSPPQWLGNIPLAGPKLVTLWQQTTAAGIKGLGDHVAPYAMKTATWFMSRAGTVGMVVIEFLLTTVIAAMFYANGETVAAGIGGFARRLAGKQGDAVMLLAEKAVRSVALGVVVTAFIQAVTGGIGLVVAGVPAAALLAAVMFMLCLAQIGPSPVLVPALFWVYWQDGLFWAAILLVFVVLAMTLDGFVRPALIRKGADMPMVMIFAGVFGGLTAFGIIGLFIGPLVLAVAHTLLKAWVSGGAEGEAFINDRFSDR